LIGPHPRSLYASFTDTGLISMAAGRRFEPDKASAAVEVQKLLLCCTEDADKGLEYKRSKIWYKSPLYEACSLGLLGRVANVAKV
jgi:hypothetical protein